MLIRERRPGKLKGSPGHPRTLRRRPIFAVRLLVESLEARSMLSASGSAGVGGSPNLAEPNSTVDQAQVLGDLSIDPQAQATGTIGNGPAQAADVDWYTFTLDGPAEVNLDLHPQGTSHPLDGVLSLYNDDPFDFGDLYDPTGYRLMVQAAGSSGSDPEIDRDLSPGTYSVAVSGAGNLYFNPLMAGSGYPGATGDFNLTASATPLAFGPNDGPAVLTSDPAANAVLDASPFVIRLDFSSALDPSTVAAGQTVTLTYNPSGNFGDGNDQDVALAWVNVSTSGTELQLAPNAPLAPGYYQVFVDGNSNTNPAVVADLNANPIGLNSANPQGQDYTATFQVDGIKGQTGASAGSDDTPSTSQDLGNITNSGLVQVAGAIGDDPYYDNSDPAHNPANDADLYHFQITGPGRYALNAEVFAGRIGSPLNPGLSLYGVDPATGALEFIADNNDTNNTTPATDGSLPLFLDSMVSQGLPAGNYYLAVADGNNVPSPAEDQTAGSFSPLDPNVTHSGQDGYTTGPYVLNLSVLAMPDRPAVIATTPAPGAILMQAPAQLTVQFDAPMNIQQLAYLNYVANDFCTLPSVYVQGSDGTDYYPRIDSYSEQTNQVSLLMLDRLAPGSYSLHLSGALGLADLGGNPLVGNTPSGDYEVQFTVEGTDLVQGSGSSQGGQIEAQPDSDGSQNLGALFADELHAGLTLAYAPAAAAATSPTLGTQPTYQFSLLIDQTYTIQLEGSPPPNGASLLVQPLTGQFNGVLPYSAGALWVGEFEPGSYKITVVGMPSGTPYQIRLTMDGTAGNPVPLVSGAGPALQFHFNAIAPLSTVPVASIAGGGDGTTGPRVSGPTDPSLPDGGGATSPPNSSDGPQSPGGGSSSNPPTATAPAAGSEFTGSLSGPVPFSPNASPGPTVTPTTGGTPQLPLLVTLNVPAENPVVLSGGTDPGLVGGTTSVAAAASLPSLATSAAGFASQVANLVSANLALLGVGPVGGVSQTGSNSAGMQTVQVAFSTQGTAPIPTALVSMITLTRSGELGDLPAPGGTDRGRAERGRRLGRSRRSRSCHGFRVSRTGSAPAGTAVQDQRYRGASRPRSRECRGPECRPGCGIPRKRFADQRACWDKRGGCPWCRGLAGGQSRVAGVCQWALAHPDHRPGYSRSLRTEAAAGPSSRSGPSIRHRAAPDRGTVPSLGSAPARQAGSAPWDAVHEADSVRRESWSQRVPAAQTPVKLLRKCHPR